MSAAAEQTALVEQILTRAAEQIGDVTAPALERFYLHLPDARAAFETHGRGNRQQLEGEMVERTLYCLMYWFDSPGEVELVLTGSAIHHHDTLQVTLDWYSGLIDATADVIAETIPPENDAERSTWRQLNSELREAVETCRSMVATPTDRHSKD